MELSPNLKLIKFENLTEEIIANTYTKTKTCKCNLCKKETKSVHSYYDKKIKDIPFGKKSVIINIRTKIFICRNKACKGYLKTFKEDLEFINDYSRRTKRLDEYILDSVVNSNSHGTETFLKKHGIKVSDTTIDRIIKKKNTK